MLAETAALRAAMSALLLALALLEAPYRYAVALVATAALRQLAQLMVGQAEAYQCAVAKPPLELLEHCHYRQDQLLAQVQAGVCALELGAAAAAVLAVTSACRLVIWRAALEAR